MGASFCWIGCGRESGNLREASEVEKRNCTGLELQYVSYSAPDIMIHIQDQRQHELSCVCLLGDSGPAVGDEHNGILDMTCEQH